METFKDIIGQLQSSGSVRLSEYYELLGYRDKYTFYRYLKSHKYHLFRRKETINTRKGNEYHMLSEDMIVLLNEYHASDEQWKAAYVDYLYGIFHRKTFLFLETKNEEIRMKLGNFVKVRGVFYDYSSIR
jgi:hypothetical protein